MNVDHFRAVASMRFQMARNQFKKSSKLNRVISVIALVLAVLVSLGSFVFALGWGSLLLSKIEPFNLIYVWDALVALFLFGWAMTVMIELQRSEMLSLRNLLHLPLSLRGAFFLNYISSLVSLVLLLFLPGAVGLCVASVIHFGSRSLVVFVLLASFLLMVTVVTYQLRGWLARLMENKRTRGTVMAVMIISFVMIFQIPNMINFGTMGSRNAELRTVREVRDDDLARLQSQVTAGEINSEDYEAQREMIQKEYREKRKAITSANMAKLQKLTETVNKSLPVGWLPYGATAAARGSVIWPWLCALGMSGIGLSSLALGYRSTVRVYTGHHNRAFRPEKQRDAKTRVHGSVLEKKIPLLSDPQSVIALAAFRSIIRAPEAKMALMTPLIFACVFGSMVFTGKLSQLPEFARPWLGVGALGISLIGMVQMMLNMFGLDRQGFRAFVLMPVRRRDILLGKNLGLFPIAAVLSAVLIIFLGVSVKMDATHMLATLLQVAVTFLLYFCVSNYTSIVAPIGIAAGTMKPVSTKFSVVGLQMLAVFLVPFVTLPATIALAAEQLGGLFADVQSVPIYLLVTFVQLPIAFCVYRFVLTRQGRMLHDHEQKILDVISKVKE